MAKITLATVKSFLKKNEGKIYISQKSDFDGMQDCVVPVRDKSFTLAQAPSNPMKNNLGIRGAWFVFGSADSFSLYDDGEYYGFDVYNCCGNFIVAIKKPTTFERAINSISMGDSVI